MVLLVWLSLAVLSAASATALFCHYQQQWHH
jgi:hypothetical protein